MSRRHREPRESARVARQIVRKAVFSISSQLFFLDRLASPIADRVVAAFEPRERFQNLAKFSAFISTLFADDSRRAVFSLSFFYPVFFFFRRTAARGSVTKRTTACADASTRTRRRNATTTARSSGTRVTAAARAGTPTSARPATTSTITRAGARDRGRDPANGIKKTVFLLRDLRSLPAISRLATLWATTDAPIAPILLSRIPEETRAIAIPSRPLPFSSWFFFFFFCMNAARSVSLLAPCVVPFSRPYLSPVSRGSRFSHVFPPSHSPDNLLLPSYRYLRIGQDNRATAKRRLACDLSKYIRLSYRLPRTH